MNNESTSNDQTRRVERSETSLFKWSCLLAAVITAALLLWMVNDVRLEVKRTTAIVHQHLTTILEQTRASTETLAAVSGDLRELRDLAGATEPRDRSLVRYADEILDLVEEQSNARIGVEKLIGTSLNEPVSAADWVADARKEAVWQSLRSGTKLQLLERLCYNRFGSPWQIQFGEDDPLTLTDWLRENHPQTREILEHNEASASN